GQGKEAGERRLAKKRPQTKDVLAHDAETTARPHAGEAQKRRQIEVGTETGDVEPLEQAVAGPREAEDVTVNEAVQGSPPEPRRSHTEQRLAFRQGLAQRAAGRR